MGFQPLRPRGLTVGAAAATLVVNASNLGLIPKDCARGNLTEILNSDVLPDCDTTTGVPAWSTRRGFGVAYGFGLRNK
jgi:hypothetical protein